MFEWTWTLQTRVGAELTKLTGATNRKVDYERSNTPQFVCDIDVHHEDAYALYAALDSGMPIVRGFRWEPLAGGVLVPKCRFAGPVLPLDAEGGGSNDSDDGSSVTVTARGAFEFLEGRFVAIAEGEIWALDLTPSGDIVQALIDEANAEDDTGIDVSSGTIDATNARDVEYSAKRISDAIDELAADFDYEIVPVADANGGGLVLGILNVYSEQGDDKPDALFGFGAGTVGNCVEYSHSKQRPCNRAIVQGDEGLVMLSEDVTSQIKHGIWAEVDSLSDTIDAGLLLARADAMLRPEPLVIVGFTPDPQLRDRAGEFVTPQVWRDYWLGDTVPLEIRDGAVTFSGSPRIDAIGITIGDDGFESQHDIRISDTTGA